MPGGVASSAHARVANLSLTALNPWVRQIQQDVDESYSLTWAADCSSASITGATVFGVRHGLETFSQLVSADRTSREYSVQGLEVVEGPRFPFRGPLLDCARHWLVGYERMLRGESCARQAHLCAHRGAHRHARVAAGAR